MTRTTVWMSLLVSLVAWPSSSAAMGEVICGSGTAGLIAACGAGGCVGKLMTCAETKIFAAGGMAIRQIEGVCDDSGSPACAGHFGYYVEACAANTPINNGGLETRLSPALFRVCYNAAGVADCSLPTGIVILEGKVSVQQHRLWPLGPPPGTVPEQPLVSFGVHTVSQRRSFRFNNVTRTLPMKSGLFISVGRNPDASLTTCNTGGSTGDCGLGGCLMQTKP